MLCYHLLYLTCPSVSSEDQHESEMARLKISLNPWGEPSNGVSHSLYLRLSQFFHPRVLVMTSN